MNQKEERLMMNWGEVSPWFLQFIWPSKDLSSKHKYPGPLHRRYISATTRISPFFPVIFFPTRRKHRLKTEVLK